MTVVVYVALYAGLLIFFFGCVRRILQYARTPVHLRWELYPVPHERPDLAAHGGSYFEETSWSTQRQHFSYIGELRAMLPEMVLMKGLWEFNRSLWYLSFLFHFGLYLVITSAVLVAFSVVLSAVAPAVAAGSFGSFIAQVYLLAGLVGITIATVGAAALLWRRTTSKDLKNYTTAADQFNLIAFIVIFLALATGYFTRPAGASVQGLVRGLVSFDTSVQVGNVFGVGLILAAALAAYIPFTHMAHFIAKYFAYHAVRWDDRVNARGGAIETAVAEYLTYRPTWAAPHIGANGDRTWAEIVSTNPAQEVRK